MGSLGIMGEVKTINDLTPSEAGAVGTFVGMIAALVIVFYIVTVIATWKIFKKAGEPGWKCLIPIYNIYIMYKIVGMKAWFWAILLTTIVGYAVISLDGSSYLFTEAKPDFNSFDASKHVPTVISFIAMFVVSIWGGILYDWRTSKAFGHGVAFFIGLLFFQPIFWLILGFDSSKYHKKAVMGATTKKKEGKEEKE